MAEETELTNIRRELVTIRQLVSEAINYIIKAESEVPERMRRFANYMHDLHSIKYMYEEQGSLTPVWVLREMERADDRYRQILDELNAAGGTFEKVRREMASDPLNRYDHTKLLEADNETRKSDGIGSPGP